MRKTILLLPVLILLAPNLVFAVWWNPFTWDVFNQSSNKTLVTQPVSTNLVKIATTSYSQVSSPTSKSIAHHFVSACQNITHSGNYVLNNDIKNVTSAACISIHDTKNINLSCQNHSVQSNNENYAISISNVNNFILDSCNLTTINPDQKTQTEQTLDISNSSGGTIKNNVIGGTGAVVSNSTDINILSNSFMGALFVTSSIRTTIQSNSIDPFTPNNGVELQSGSYNSLIANNIDGQSDGNFQNLNGADDGIQILNETNDNISSNSIKNTYNCGVENAGYMFDSQINLNTITNTGNCGIGGWYWSSVKGNVISNNIVQDSATLFEYGRDYGLRASDPLVYFLNNSFTNNVLANQKIPSDPAPHASQFSITTLATVNSGESPITSGDLILGNNVFKNNNFGTSSRAVVFNPVSMIVDGGGNICPQSGDSGYPLKCGTSAITNTPPDNSNPSMSGGLCSQGQVLQGSTCVSASYNSSNPNMAGGLCPSGQKWNGSVCAP